MKNIYDTLEVNKINGNIAVLCNENSLSTAANLIKSFSSSSNVSLYIENNNNVNIFDQANKSSELNGASGLKLDCSLNQCFSPMEYTCTVCIGDKETYMNIAESCSRYATPVYMLENCVA